MSRYVRKADLDAARKAIRVAPGCHHPRVIAGACFDAMLMGGMPAIPLPLRRRWDELAEELDRRWEAAARWGYDPAKDRVLHPEPPRD